MVEYRIKDGEFFMTAFLNGGTKSLVFANGIPSYITKHHPIVRFCKENNLNLFLPRYYGSLESGGKFSLENCSKALERALEIVSFGKTVELFGNSEISWNKDNIILFGYSFGALPALMADVSKNVRVILNCPFINTNMNTLGGGSAEKELFFIARAYPNLFNFNAKEIIEEYNSIQYPLSRDFIMITGSNDVVITKEEVDFLKGKYFPRHIEFEGGHSISYDKLKELI